MLFRGKDTALKYKLVPFGLLFEDEVCRSPALKTVPPVGFEPTAFCSGGRRSIP